MNSIKITCLLAALNLCFAAIPVLAQDQVTIPKARLQELERKEAELEKLSKPRALPGASARQNTRDSAPAVALTNLPPIKAGDTVESEHLAAYYQQDPASADQRFRKVKVLVRGEIGAFSKPAFRRNYRIVLMGSAADNKVVCDFTPPDQFKAVFTTDDGLQLVALQGETRIPLAKVGDRILIEGTVKGRRGLNVSVVGKTFSIAR